MIDEDVDDSTDNSTDEVESIVTYIQELGPEEAEDTLQYLITSLDRKKRDRLHTEMEKVGLVHILQKIIAKREKKFALSRERRPSRKKEDKKGIGEEYKSFPVVVSFELCDLLGLDKRQRVYPLDETGDELIDMMCNFVVAIDRADEGDKFEIYAYIDEHVDIYSEGCIIGMNSKNTASYCLYYIGESTKYKDYNPGLNRCLHINQIFTKKNERGKGYLRNMLNSLKKIIINENVKLKNGDKPIDRIELKVDTELEDTIAKYKKIGFKVVETINVGGSSHYFMVYGLRATLRHYK